MELLSTIKEYPKVEKLSKGVSTLTGEDLSNQQTNQFAE